MVPYELVNVADDIAKTQRLVGRVLADKFRLTACIGIGGTGAVYRADQMALGRTVAVKILKEELAADDRVVARFRDEAMAASRLNHPNTVSIIDYGQAPDGLLYLAMEYVRGPTLTQLITREHPLPVTRVLEIMSQILSGIDEAHHAGVVHADLKSDNIIVDQRRATDIVKLVDFGIARLMTGTQGNDGDERSVCGTPEYMAPEVIAGSPPGYAADLYAAGIILYELLTCETPFVGGTTIDILSKQLKSAPKPLSQRRPDLPAGSEFDLLCKRALAKSPIDRFASAPDMRAAIISLVARITGTAPMQPADPTCEQCGTRCSPTFRFCPECGNPRVGVAARVVTQAPPMTELDHLLGLPMVGRDPERTRIIAHLRGADGDDAPRTLIVVGEAGIGRTRLVDQACQDVVRATPHDAKLTVYKAGADPSGLVSTYYPIRSLLASLLELPELCSETELHRAVLDLGLGDPDVFGIAHLFGHASPLSEMPPTSRRRESVASVLRVVERCAEQRPMTIVFDDIERYDHPSQEMLRRLAEAGATMPPCVLISEPTHAAQWPVEIPRVELRALTEANVAKLAAFMITHRPSRSTLHGEVVKTSYTAEIPAAATLMEHTHGHPAHIDHLARFAQEGGRLDADAPMSLADVIAARLSMLPQASLEFCQAAAVFGMEALLNDVRATSLVADCDTALNDATTRGILELSGDGKTVRFVSGLVRDVAYDATPADVRRALHAAAHDALEVHGGDRLLLGHHSDLGGHAAAAIHLLVSAGDRAARQLDDALAARLYQRALIAVRNAVRSGDADDRADSDFVSVSTKLADALRTRGDIGLARGVIAEARDWATVPILEAMLDRALALVFSVEDDHDGAAQSLQKGIGKAIGAGDMAFVVELYLDLANVLVNTGDALGARRELIECIDVVTLGEGVASLIGPAAAQLREPRNLWRLLKRKALIVSSLGDNTMALALGESALAHAQRVNSRIGIARAASLLAVVFDRLSQPEVADRFRSQAVNEMRGLGDRRATSDLLSMSYLASGPGSDGVERALIPATAGARYIRATTSPGGRARRIST